MPDGPMAGTEGLGESKWENDPSWLIPACSGASTLHKLEVLGLK